MSEVLQWLHFSRDFPHHALLLASQMDRKDALKSPEVKSVLKGLYKALKSKTFLVGERIGLADVALFAEVIRSLISAFPAFNCLFIGPSVGGAPDPSRVDVERGGPERIPAPLPLAQHRLGQERGAGRHRTVPKAVVNLLLLSRLIMIKAVCNKKR